MGSSRIDRTGLTTRMNARRRYQTRVSRVTSYKKLYEKTVCRGKVLLADNWVKLLLKMETADRRT